MVISWQKLANNLYKLNIDMYVVSLVFIVDKYSIDRLKFYNKRRGYEL